MDRYSAPLGLALRIECSGLCLKRRRHGRREKGDGIEVEGLRTPCAGDCDDRAGDDEEVGLYESEK